MQLIIDISYGFVLFLMIAYGFAIFYRVMGFFHMAHAIALTLGAYLVYTGCIVLAWPLWLSILLSVAFVVFFMVLVNGGVYQSIMKRGVDGWKLMIVSLGIYVVLQNVVSLAWGDGTMTFRTWPVKPGHTIFGGIITDVQIITIAVSALLICAVWWLLEKTNIGMSIKATASNPSLSDMLGVKKGTVSALSIGLGSALMACAGILIAADVDMTPTMGFDWLMYGVVAMIIGGMGKMRYMVLGAFLLAMAQQLSAYFLDAKWMNATAYVILVFFLYFKPFGFSGKKLKKAEV